MRRAIRTHLRDFLATFGLVLLAGAIAIYILDQQRFGFPLVGDDRKLLRVELESAQAVQAGQGQTVRVAGVEIGTIGDVEVEDGVAVVEVEIESEFEDVIREDATALLRPRTGLKDMMLEVDPGQGEALDDGGRIPVANSAPDVNPDEFYSALDADTRDYLKLLVSGAGKGLRGRGSDLSRTLEQLEPLHRDLARVAGAAARRRDALRRLVNRYGVLMAELGRHPADLRRVVSTSGSVFDALAGEGPNISETVARLPGTLRQTESTLARVDTLAGVLRPALDALRPPFRTLDRTNAVVRPFLRESTPIVRDRIRPYVRAAGPYVDDLRPAARDLASASPDLTESLRELNRLFNIGAYNPGGAESPRVVGGNDVRQDGFLYWLAWASNNGVSLFSTADAQGVYRRLVFCGLPAGLLGPLQLAPIVTEIAAQEPALLREVAGGLAGQGLLGAATPSPTQVSDAVIRAVAGTGDCRFEQ
jgi:phospholipid/cholesterol/gamma-HCH transport system substrate-binding protein